jgi:hypothetical protein
MRKNNNKNNNKNNDKDSTNSQPSVAGIWPKQKKRELNQPVQNRNAVPAEEWAERRIANHQASIANHQASITVPTVRQRVQTFRSPPQSKPAAVLILEEMKARNERIMAWSEKKIRLYQ